MIWSLGLYHKLFCPSVHWEQLWCVREICRVAVTFLHVFRSVLSLDWTVLFACTYRYWGEESGAQYAEPVWTRMFHEIILLDFWQVLSIEMFKDTLVQSHVMSISTVVMCVRYQNEISQCACSGNIIIFWESLALTFFNISHIQRSVPASLER